MFDLMKLHDGCSIKGVAYEGEPGEEITLDEETAGRIGGSFTYWLGQKVQKNYTDLKICVCHDPRLSSETLKTGLLKGMTMFGAEGYDAGLAAVPAACMAPASLQFEFDGAVMITADNLPYNMNGFRFFTADGSLSAEDISAVLKRAASYNFIGEYYEIRKASVMPMYSIYMRQMISREVQSIGGNLKGMHIVVDAGNGVGGFFATEILKPMGADITGSIFLDPDGRFPNHQPDPGNKEAMKAVCRAVTDNGADLGLIFDAGAACFAAAGPDGRPLSTDEVQSYQEGSEGVDGCPDDGILPAVRLVIRAALLKAAGRDITAPVR